MHDRVPELGGTPLNRPRWVRICQNFWGGPATKSEKMPILCVFWPPKAFFVDIRCGFFPQWGFRVRGTRFRHYFCLWVGGARSATPTQNELKSPARSAGALQVCTVRSSGWAKFFGLRVRPQCPLPREARQRALGPNSETEKFRPTGAPEKKYRKRRRRGPKTRNSQNRAECVVHGVPKPQWGRRREPYSQNSEI